MKAQWNNTTIAESDTTIIVEGNHYFPRASLKLDYFEKNHTETTCPWKGCASYYTINVNGKKLEDAAWYYKEPSSITEHIKDYVAFNDEVSIISE